MAEKTRAQLKELLSIAQEQACENLNRALVLDRLTTQQHEKLVAFETENERLTNAAENYIRTIDRLQVQLAQTTTTAQSVVIGMGKLFANDGQGKPGFSPALPPLPF